VIHCCFFIRFSCIFTIFRYVSADKDDADIPTRILSWIYNLTIADWAYYIIVGYCLLMLAIVLGFWLLPKTRSNETDDKNNKKE
jgi:uncharacterized BrkB/YihY/UPF0761 family membrane protein